MKRIAVAFALVFMTASYQNCAPSSFEAVGGSVEIQSNYIAYQKSCQFIDSDTLSAILSSHLGLASGDVAMVDDQGRAIRSNNCRTYNNDGRGNDCNYIEVFGADLADPLCTASKFKVVSEIMINACSIGLAQEETRTRLFPNGIEDIDHLYFSFTGRSPTSDEREIVVSAIEDESISTEEREAMACAIVASSLASVTVL